MTDSEGKYTGWLQISHLDEGTGNINFFNRNNPTIKVNIPMSSKNNLWYISQPYRALVNNAQTNGEMFHQYNEARNKNNPFHEPHVFKITSQAQYELWHQRTLHSGTTVLENLPHCVDSVPKNLCTCKHNFFHCDSCSKGKATKPLVNKDEDIKCSQPGERFHMDFGFVRSEDEIKNKDGFILKGPLICSHNGYNSYLLAVDKYSRYIWVFLSKTKVPPIATVKKFLQMHGIPDHKSNKFLRTIRTDNGGELAGCEEFERMVNEAGYSLETTAPGTSSQNEIAEQPHKTVGNGLRSTLHSAGLSGKYWSDILLQAVFVKNKLPYAHFEYKNTPYTVLTGKRASLSKLRIPGS